MIEQEPKAVLCCKENERATCCGNTGTRKEIATWGTNRERESHMLWRCNAGTREERVRMEESRRGLHSPSN
jgi:predicted Fe-S protein YdhL (DUF1289 family)